MGKFKVDNKLALTALSALFGAGAFVVDVLSKKSEQTEVAEKAAKIVMKNLSKDKN